MHGRTTRGPSKKLDPETRSALRKSRLSHGSPHAPGIRRKRTRHGFSFVHDSGRSVRDSRTIERIRKLAIPPAWEEVWISTDPDAHLQAVGRDARGRRQYKYHDRWRKTRDEAKYDHVIAFAKALPKIRRTARRHLRKRGLPRDKVLAAVVLVMEKTLIRVGNDEYARHNGSYGLTTLQDSHAKVSRRRIRFVFRGKSGIEHDINLDDPTLARIVAGCRDLPGEELFQYVDDDGAVRDIGADDVNAYLRDITGQDVTAKDYRTWAGTVMAAKALKAFEKQGSGKPLKKHLLNAIETVAARLGNTRAVCRKCYIHPAVMDAYLDGTLASRLRKRASAELQIARRHGWEEDEAAVLRMLESTL